MGIFGGSYPAGCSGPPEDYASFLCMVCGKHCDDCVCPECPVCLTFGAPSCYALTPEGHGLKYTVAQLEARAEREAADKAQAETDKAEGDYWSDPQRKVEEAHYDQLMWDELAERGHE